MAFQLPKLPFAPDSLAPHISKETIDFHYGKHHQGYVDKVNELVKGSPEPEASLEEIVCTTSGKLFNNAAQAWNHTFYWHSLSPEKPDWQISGALEKALSSSFGGRDEFLAKFVDSAAENFGSGWTWLVRSENGGLEIVNTSNAETPLTTNDIPLLVTDVWEHAYYIDYRNERKKYLEGVKQLLHWRFASERFDEREAFRATPEMRAKRAA
jgi:Fe-Mn family superoxide dismutase